MTQFNYWLLMHYGFEPDMTPILNRPPTFYSYDSPDGRPTFNTKAYEAWKTERYKEFLMLTEHGDCTCGMACSRLNSH